MKGGTSDSAVLTTGESQSFAFQVSNTEAFRATLVWMDPPCPLGSAVTMVNDLDLVITDAAGTVFYPNGLNAADRTNNVERIDGACLRFRIPSLCL